MGDACGMCLVFAFGIKFEEHVYQKAKAMKSVEWNSVSIKRSCDILYFSKQMYEKG